MVNRRTFLASAAIWFAGTTSLTRATTIRDHLPWSPFPSSSPEFERPGPWQFFTADEARAVEALVDCIIPPDSETPGGKDAGCAVFIDRQLAGPYGRQEGLYVRPPFQVGAKNQGHQSHKGPAQEYREGLAAFDSACRAMYGGKSFAELSAADKDAVLKGLERGDFKLESADGKSFFEQAVKDVQMGFFADPVYGGNRDMVAWKMIGYPGARYNYLDWVSRHNEKFPLPPVSLTGRAEWTQR